MSKQTGAHTHEEKGKMFQLFSFYRIGSFLYRFIFREHALSEKYSFLISCYFSWLSYYWGRLWRYVSGYENNRKFSPNIHLLMTLAAVGSALMGSFEESALLILILRRRISLKIMLKAKANVKLQNY